MKRVICSIIVVFVLLHTACIGAYAEPYSELWEERAQYLEDWNNWKYAGELYDYYPMLSGNLTVLLYTDIANELTFEKIYSEGGDLIGPEYLVVFGDYGIESPEINEAIQSCKTGYTKSTEVRSALKECVLHFDISKEELLNAYKTMRDNPDAIREILSFLSDEEYQQLKIEKELGYENGTFGKTEWPNFILDALYIEDDATAQRLLCKPFALYVKELGRVVTGKDLFYHFNASVEEFAEYDLTHDDVGGFLTYCREKYLPDDWRDSKDGRTAEEKIEYLEAAREAQLQAAQTGDGAVNALWVIAFAIPALAVVTAKRKRRI